MRRVAAALLAVLLAGGAAARNVDYSLDDAAMRAAAERLKITPVSPPPARGEDDIALVIAPGVDHETLALGMLCSAYKVRNPVSALLPRIAAAWDRDGDFATPPGQAAVTLRITAGRSYRRCIAVGEMDARCITKVTIDGVVEANGRSAPVSGMAERDASIGGFCGALAQGIGVVGREAAIALIADARLRLASLRDR